jgi:hypothetical protein
MTHWAKIADGTLGFKNLRTLNIYFGGLDCSDGSDDQPAFLDALWDFPQMDFPTRQLRVEFHCWEVPHNREYDQDDIVTPLLEKFTLKTDKPIHELWTRFYMYENAEISGNVKQFPAPERDSEKVSTRFTVKAMALNPKEEWYKWHSHQNCPVRK